MWRLVSECSAHGIYGVFLCMRVQMMYVKIVIWITAFHKTRDSPSYKTFSKPS